MGDELSKLLAEQFLAAVVAHFMFADSFYLEVEIQNYIGIR
jgi:hypothetical protein